MFGCGPKYLNGYCVFTNVPYICRMSTIEVFVYNLKCVKYGKLPTVACKNAFKFYATCVLLTHPAHHMFV